ncbi:hypothetical protein SAMN05216532_3445 [Streptomyces sp. 2231.1]|nr:hypothetical protein [Streptomyces sp. 2231.1]SED10391.1 hypothetical protein SAMN05216532_3445 [Streptomyces sp. 2231.1]
MSTLWNLVTEKLPWPLAVFFVIAVAVYELVMAAAGSTALRLPLLILKCARLGMSREDWEYERPEYEAEALFHLGNRKRNWVMRLVDALIFATPLAAVGLRRAAKSAVRTTMQTKKRRAAQGQRTHAAHIRAHRRPRRPASSIAMRAGVAGGVLGTLSVAGASQSGQGHRPEAWMNWVATSLLGVLGITLGVVIILGVRESRRAKRKVE